MGEVYRARDPRLGRDVAREGAAAGRHRRTRPGWRASSRRRAPSPRCRTPTCWRSSTSAPARCRTWSPSCSTARRCGRGWNAARSTQADAIGFGAADRRRPGRRARPRRRAPRSEARQHLRDRRRPREDPRLRPGHHRGRRRAREPDSTDTTAVRTLPGLILGTLGLPVAGAGAGRAASITAPTSSRAARSSTRCSPGSARSAASRRPRRSRWCCIGRPRICPSGPASSPALAAAVRRCLAQDPGRRFQTAHDLAPGARVDLARRHAGRRRRVAGAAASVAVLPFVNLSGAADDQYFSDGLAEDLVNALARLPGLRVASRTSSFRFRGRELDVRRGRARAGRRRRARGQRAALGDAAAAHRAPDQRRRRLSHLVRIATTASWPTSSRCRTRW